MHQNHSARRFSHLLVTMVAVALTTTAAAAPQPDAAQLEPVLRLTAFMSTLHLDDHPTVFARGLCIVENFAPYLFCGPGAAAAWEKGFRAHAADDDLTELQAHFGEAYDFSVDSDRAYFSLPTTWTGKTHGRTFEEHGAWAFVLERHGSSWRILGYGWGVTSYAEAAH